MKIELNVDMRATVRDALYDHPTLIGCPACGQPPGNDCLAPSPGTCKARREALLRTADTIAETIGEAVGIDEVTP